MKMSTSLVNFDLEMHLRAELPKMIKDDIEFLRAQDTALDVMFDYKKEDIPRFLENRDYLLDTLFDNISGVFDNDYENMLATNACSLVERRNI
jgi:hypothetical protein